MHRSVNEVGATAINCQRYAYYACASQPKLTFGARDSTRSPAERIWSAFPAASQRNLWFLSGSHYVGCPRTAPAGALHRSSECPLDVDLRRKRRGRLRRPAAVLRFCPYSCGERGAVGPHIGAEAALSTSAPAQAYERSAALSSPDCRDCFATLSPRRRDAVMSNP